MTLTDLIGYTATLRAGSLLTAFGGLIALIFLQETCPACQSNQGKPITIKTPKLNFKTGLASTIPVYGVNRFVTNGILIAILGLLVQERMGTTYTALGVASVTGALSAGRNFGLMFSSVVSGKVSDWLGNRWRIILWSLTLGAVGMAFLALNSPVALLVGVFLAAIARGGMQTLSSTLTGDIVDPQQQGAAIGLVHTAGDLGSAIGPPFAFGILPWVGFKGVYLLCMRVLLLQMIPVY